MFVSLCQTQEPIDFVAHIAEASRLPAISVDSQILTAQGLLPKIRDDAAIVQLHSWAVGIKDTHDAGIHFVMPAVRHGHGLCEPLVFVKDRSRPDRIYVSPVCLFLRML